jgi:hypothetical protein
MKDFNINYQYKRIDIIMFINNSIIRSNKQQPKNIEQMKMKDDPLKYPD